MLLLSYRQLDRLITIIKEKKGESTKTETDTLARTSDCMQKHPVPRGLSEISVATLSLL